MAELGEEEEGKMERLEKLDFEWDKACTELAQWIRENLVWE